MRSDPGFFGRFAPDRRPPAQLIDNLLNLWPSTHKRPRTLQMLHVFQYGQNLPRDVTTSHAPLGEDRRLRELNCQTSLYPSSKVSLSHGHSMPHLTVITLVYAAVSSLSLSFFATAVDSVFDPMSGLLLWKLHRMSKSWTLTMASWWFSSGNYRKYLLRYVSLGLVSFVTQTSPVSCTSF